MARVRIDATTLRDTTDIKKEDIEQQLTRLNSIIRDKKGVATARVDAKYATQKQYLTDLLAEFD